MTDKEYKTKYHSLHVMIRAEAFAARYNVWKRHIEIGSLAIDQLKQAMGISL